MNAPTLNYRLGPNSSGQEGGLDSLIDQTFGSTVGSILYRSSGNWRLLTPGTRGSTLAMGASVPAWLAPGATGSTLVMGANDPAWVTTTAKGSELAGTVVVAKIPLTATVAPGVLTGGSWGHPTAAIIITRIIVSTTIVSTGVATLSIGVAADATTTSANLIDALDVNAATLCVDNVGSGGTLGKTCQPMGITQFLNIAGSADTTGLVGNVYVYYHLQ